MISPDSRDFSAFPPSARENEEGDIVPSYQAGNGNEPKYPPQDSEIPHEFGEAEDFSDKKAANAARKVVEEVVEEPAPMPQELRDMVDKYRSEKQSDKVDGAQQDELMSHRYRVGRNVVLGKSRRYRK